MADDAAIQDLYRKIKREREIINAANNMRQASTNAAVASSIDSQVRESRRNIQYFEQTLQELQQRKMGDGMRNMNLGQGNGGPPPPAHSAPRMGSSALPQPPDNPYDDPGSYGAGGYSDGNNPGMPNRAPYGPPPPGPQGRVPRARPNYSRLDLIKAETPHLGPRIQLMLSQLEFKLSVEKQYKDGIEKMVRLYELEGDRKSKADAEGRRVESMQKMMLLKQALKRHGDLHVDVGPDMQDDDSLNMPSQRKPLSGHIQIKVHGIADVNHASTGRFSRSPETFVIMKVEDSLKGRTRATRNDKWTDEQHEFDIDKANEIEFTVYDRAGDHPQPIGMLWMRISDIAEEMRRKRIETEFNNSGWISADRMGEGGAPQGSQSSMQFQPPPGSTGGTGQFQQPGAAPPASTIFIDDWFSLEPYGRIRLTISFVKQNRERRPLDLGLGRKGAIRQKKEEVVEQFGHKFVQQTFYNIMRCSLCGEFLKYTAGMQCADCRLTCHKKCYAKVVTKCISKSNAETDPDEEKINHRIPHRFEPFSNMGANWCTHCGYMLPLGRKQGRKCTECGTTCHINCTHFVPDFCGMSMEAANQILAEMKNAKARQGQGPSLANKTLRPPSGRPSPAPSTGSFGGAPSQDTTGSSDPRWSYGKQDSAYDAQSQLSQRPGSYSQQYDMSKAAATQAHQNSSRPTPGSPEPPRPQGGRSQSHQNLAAQAASNALGSKPAEPRYQRTSTDYAGQQGQRTSGQGYGRPPEPPSASTDPRSRLSQPPGHPVYDPSAYAQISNYSPQSPQHPQSPPQQQYPPSQDPYARQQHPPQKQMQQMSPPQQPQSPQAPPPKIQPQPSADTTVATTPRKQPGQTGHTVRVGLSDFEFLAVLGKGNFGKVMLAETKASRKLYAIKVLKKEFIIENDEVESTRSEKRVFLIANRERHPFLLNLHACFQTETRIYFVMEYVSGGDLMLHIQRGQFGTKRAQFYAAEVCLALKYFHENGVVYRDLKLDNILLTLDGHIKIADYGLCKEDMWYGSTTGTFCGTPEFMAPEILLDKKYGRAVDWWAFGVLIYQMLLQQSPFRGEDEDEIYDAILADEPLYPIHMPRDSVSILQKLLTREPELRLGSGPTDAQEIMSHAFFRNVNWDDIYHKRVPAPFAPSVQGKADTSNFDSEFTSMKPDLTPVHSVLTQAMQEEFRGFSYTANFE
ncbi:hypothetical protein KVT40_004183 [Elsinoe batatas]|uniref:protein kinase C n=1 Tax=Elsinoe batatas TaxID=2601811 RepID=A0A8K0L3M8_9PEZI|nr:hypothetical protein KVT40_004183 [Elsinoe batatas]